MTSYAGRADRLGFETWAEDRRPALLRVALAITRDRDSAEDLLQTALTKVYLAWDDVRDQGALDGYVRRVMTNTHSTWWSRGHRRQESAVGTELAVGTATGPDGFAVVEDRAELGPLLRALPQQQRATVALRYLQDRSVDETAEVLGISPGTVKSQTSRAIAMMRRAGRPLEPAA